MPVLFQTCQFRSRHASSVKFKTCQFCWRYVNSVQCLLFLCNIRHGYMQGSGHVASVQDMLVLFNTCHDCARYVTSMQCMSFMYKTCHFCAKYASWSPKSMQDMHVGSVQNMTNLCKIRHCQFCTRHVTSRIFCTCQFRTRRVTSVQDVSILWMTCHGCDDMPLMWNIYCPYWMA